MKKWMLGGGLMALCVIGCAALPLILVGSAGLIGWMFNPWVGGGILFLGVAGVLLYLKSRKKQEHSCSADGSCGCSTKSKGWC
jgi:hypothetical protein